MSYLLDIFNKRQPAPAGNPTASSWLDSKDLRGTNPWQRPMPMPGGGPNQPTQMPAPAPWDIQQGAVPPMDVATAIARGIPPAQIKAQSSPPPGLAAMFPGGSMAPPPGPTPGWGGQMPQGPGMGSVGQMPAPNMPGNPNNTMPAFQPPQPMPFNNRPMPQFGAPNFSQQGGMIGAPQPSPMNGMMKGMFGVR